MRLVGLVVSAARYGSSGMARLTQLLLSGLVWGLRSKKFWTQNMPVVTTHAPPGERRAAARYIHPGQNFVCSTPKTRSPPHELPGAYA